MIKICGNIFFKDSKVFLNLNTLNYTCNRKTLNQLGNILNYIYDFVYDQQCMLNNSFNWIVSVSL